MIWDLDIRANLLDWNRSLELNNHFSGALSYLEKPPRLADKGAA